MSPIDKETLLDVTRDIVSAYVANNALEADALPDIIHQVYTAVEQACSDKPAGEGDLLEPAVPIADSLTDAAIICLEDGLVFQSLKRHLRVKYNMTPEAYREKWGLPHDYPMVAPNYAKRRSALAKKTGLGKKRPGS